MMKTIATVLYSLLIFISLNTHAILISDTVYVSVVDNVGVSSPRALLIEYHSNHVNNVDIPTLNYDFFDMTLTFLGELSSEKRHAKHSGSALTMLNSSLHTVVDLFISEQPCFRQNTSKVIDKCTDGIYEGEIVFNPEELVWEPSSLQGSLIPEPGVILLTIIIISILLIIRSMAYKVIRIKKRSKSWL